MTALWRPVRLLSLALLGLALAASGCISPCMQVQRSLCECQFVTQADRNSCEDAANAQKNLEEPTPEESEACVQIAETCADFIEAHPPSNGNCPALQTPEGRKACGISD